MKYGNDDLAKYTFMPEAGDYIRKNEISIAELVSPTFKHVLNRAEERVLEAIRSTKVSDKRSVNQDVEIMSFPVALMLVRSTNLNHLMDRYSLAEAIRVESLLKQENKEEIIEDIFHTFLGVELEHSTVSNFPGFKISLSEFAKRAVKFHKPEWKLVNRIVQDGKVYVSQIDLIRLIREEIRDLILQRLKATNVPKLPKELDVMVKKIIELTPPPRSTFTSLNIAPENYPPCTKPDEIILGDNIPISQLQVGQHAIGRTGLNKVTKTFARPYSGPMIRIEPSSMLPIEVTPEHPLLVSSSISKNGHKIRGFTPLVWKQAKDITPKKNGVDGDYVVLPILVRDYEVKELTLESFTNKRGLAIAKAIHIPVSFALDEDTAWLLGLFVAEGSTSRHGREIAFSLNENEIDIHERICQIARKLNYSSYKQKIDKLHITKCIIASALLSRAFRHWCGERATNKKIPDFIMLNMNDRIIRAFLKGWEDGDGYRYQKRNSFTGSTVSKTLALQLQLLYTSIGRVVCLDQLHLKNKTSIINGRQVFLHDKYLVRCRGYMSKFPHYRKVADNILCPVKKVNPFDYKGEVHNIETSDNTFLVSNAVVHNCVKEALRQLESGTNLPHYGRFLMATYLLAVGKTVEDIVGLFPKSPDFKKTVTQYQVEHIAGIKGGHTKYRVPSCKTLQTHSFCFKDPVKCYEISSPLQFPSRRKPASDDASKVRKLGATPREEKRKGWTKTRS